MKRYAVIVAGGRGVRMGAATPKQFLDLAGEPVLRRTVECFLGFDPPVEIILALPSSHRDWWRDYCRRTGFLKRYTMAPGGITRFHSVQNALEYVGDEGLVAVHDGVRPLLGRDLLERLFSEAETSDAVIPVVPVPDSVRRIVEVDGRRASEPVERDGLVRVQTPQVFRAQVIKEAYRQPFSPLFTDDASVVEASGVAVKAVPGDRVNLKVTTPEDLRLAEGLFRLFSCGRESR